jgi:hypothetical protein
VYGYAQVSFLGAQLGAQASWERRHPCLPGFCVLQFSLS